MKKAINRQITFNTILIRSIFAGTILLALGYFFYSSNSESTTTIVLLANKRYLVDNILSRNECDEIMSLLMSKNLTYDYVGAGLFGKNAWQLWGEISITNTSDQIRAWNLFWVVQDRALSLIKKYFHDDKVYMEYAHLVLRGNQSDEYAHGIHADNCRIHFDSGLCEPTPEACCSWRDYSLLLYLNGNFTGGDIFFTDKESQFTPVDPIHPKCGRAVLFTSGAENLHGVTRIENGWRYTFATWYTKDASRKAPEKCTFEQKC